MRLTKTETENYVVIPETVLKTIHINQGKFLREYRIRNIWLVQVCCKIFEYDNEKASEERKQESIEEDNFI